MIVVGFVQDGEYSLHSAATYFDAQGDAYEVSFALLKWWERAKYPNREVLDMFVADIMSRFGEGRIIIDMKDVDVLYEAVAKNRLDIARHLCDTIVEKSELLVRKEALERRLEPEIIRREQQYKEMRKHLRE